MEFKVFGSISLMLLICMTAITAGVKLSYFMLFPIKYIICNHMKSYEIETDTFYASMRDDG